jgi:hypothetical protein
MNVEFSRISWNRVIKISASLSVISLIFLDSSTLPITDLLILPPLNNSSKPTCSQDCFQEHYRDDKIMILILENLHLNFLNYKWEFVPMEFVAGETPAFHNSEKTMW